MDLVPRFVCTSDTKLQTDFARGATITTFGIMFFFPPDWGMLRRSRCVQISLETQIHNYLCQECGGYGQGYGRIEVHTFFYSREEEGRWRQGPRCLRCSKLRRIGGLGGLMMTPRRSSGCGAYTPELSTRRHRGLEQGIPAPDSLIRLGTIRTYFRTLGSFRDQPSFSGVYL